LEVFLRIRLMGMLAVRNLPDEVCTVPCAWARPGCRRQSLAVARGTEDGLDDFLEAAAGEIEGWT